MAIVQTINESMFHDAFHRMGRGKQFSYEARQSLFEHYEELSEGTGEPIELDVIAICCDWAEYTVDDFLADHYDFTSGVDSDFRETSSDADMAAAILDWLRERTTAMLVPRHNPHTGNDVPPILVASF